MLNLYVEMDEGCDAFFPKKAHKGDACYDLYSVEDTVLPPESHMIVNTGVHTEFPPSYELIIRGRSGMASKGIYTHVGTVDSNYRNSIGVVLFNTTERPYEICRGDRIGQMQLQMIPDYVLIEKKVSENNERGQKGFGSSGR